MIRKILFLLFFPIICIGQQINPNFGNNGSVTTDLANDHDFLGELLTLSDGKTLLFGNSYVSTNSNLNGFAIIKYNADGSYDNSFGIRGKVIMNFDSYQNSRPTSAILQSDGKILIIGNTANNTRGAITRLLTNGETDIDFGFNGKMILESKEVYKILLTPDQKIVILGRTLTDFSIEKLNSNGFYDTTFGNNGITTLDDTNNFEVFISGEIMNDGNIICVGNSSNPNFTGNKVVITKFNTNGLFDSSFGIKRINIPITTFNQNSYVRDMKISTDYSMLLLVDGVFTDVNTQTFSDSRMYKIDMNGNLITSFAANGYYQFNRCFGCETKLENFEILDNHKIIVTMRLENYDGNNYILTSLHNFDGSFNTNFGYIQIPLNSDFSQGIKTKVNNNILFTAYNRISPLNNYYINSYLIDNQLLSASTNETIFEKTTIYPNPFSDKININFPEIDIQNIKITVSNIHGSEIFSKNRIDISNNKTLSIDQLSNYSSGIYFLKIQSDNYTKTFKIIKK